jgi:hypothetical protein
MDYLSFFSEHTNNYVFPLLCSIVIDIFSSPGEPILLYKKYNNLV